MTADHFLRLIRENLNDETTRLVFADWLEESGEAARAKVYRDGNIPLANIEVRSLLKLSDLHWTQRTGRGAFAFIRDLYRRVSFRKMTVLSVYEYKKFLQILYRRRLKLPKLYWEFCPQYTRRDKTKK